MGSIGIVSIVIYEKGLSSSEYLIKFVTQLSASNNDLILNSSLDLCGFPNCPYKSKLKFMNNTETLVIENSRFKNYFEKSKWNSPFYKRITDKNVIARMLFSDQSKHTNLAKIKVELVCFANLDLYSFLMDNPNEIPESWFDIGESILFFGEVLLGLQDEYFVLGMRLTKGHNPMSIYRNIARQ